MRIPPLFSTLAFTLSTLTRGAHSPTRNAALGASQPLRLRASMTRIPFLSALFGSSSKAPDMSFPDQRSNDEWRAVLNKGKRRQMASLWGWSTY